MKETNIKYSNWKKRKVVWYKLKDNDKYSAKMVAKVLCTNAKKRDMNNPTKKEIQDIATLYNASTVKKVQLMERKYISIISCLQNIICISKEIDL